jgi:lipopolysaccharide heptosyltransferase II
LRILLVRLRLIGDVVFTTPLVRALRRRFPQATIAYIVEPAAAAVLHGNPHLDTLHIVPKRRGLSRVADDVAVARQLRRESYDVAIDLHGGPRSAWLTWASGARMRIGYTIAGRRWMYTHPIRRSPDLAPRHSVLNQWDLLAPLGIEACDPGRDAVEMPADEAAAERIGRILGRHGIEPHHRVAVVHVSAGNPFRRWPPESFAALAAALIRRDAGRRVVLVSGPSERDAADAIARAARAALDATADSVVALDVDLPELRALVARAAVYIGGDSGPLHVAATTTTPIVALLGPTLPERSLPWRDPRWFAEAVDAGTLPCRPCAQRRCGPGDFRCLAGIAPERVAAAAERALASGSDLIPAASDRVSMSSSTANTR